MFTDIVGFSRQMGTNEARTLQLLDLHNQIIQQAVTEHHGHVIKTIGDAFLVEFPSVVNAIQCAQHSQAQLRRHNAENEKTEQIHVRIGIHLGDIVQKDGDVFGDGVNIASRLQTLAEPDTICISDVVYRDVAKKLDLGTVVSLGKPKLKNIAERFQVYALLPEKPAGFHQRLQVQRLKLKQWRRPLQGAALLVLLASAGLIGRYFYVPTPAGLPLPDKPSIAVLPFVNMSGDPDQEYFSDGITEDITADLSKISNLFVIARNSAFTYKGKATRVQDVGRELGVRYVLEGSVRRSDDRVRITAQLVDATRGQHLWSERYDRPPRDLFALQDEITQQIVSNLNAEVMQAELERVRRTPTENLTAYDYYLRGIEYRNRLTKEANVQARQMVEKAIELDPQFAMAYAFLGWNYYLEWIWQWSPDPQALGQASALAQKAIASDDSLADAHTLLGIVHLYKNRQYEQAIAEGERAIVLNLNYAFGYFALAETMNFAGKPEEAMGLAEKAMRLDPRWREWYVYEVGLACYLTRRYEEAITALKSALARYPNHLGAHRHLAAVYSALGREEEARAETAEVLRISPNYSLESARQRLPFKDPAILERQLAALRKTGLK
jgi:TolB-like protein/class 3 adenylate cyclase